jgi:hypothetical protein
VGCCCCDSDTRHRCVGRCGCSLQRLPSGRGQYQLTTHMSYLFAGGALERCFVLRSPAGDELVSCAYTHSLYEVAWKRAMTTRSNDRRERQIARKMMKAA